MKLFMYFNNKNIKDLGLVLAEDVALPYSNENIEEQVVDGRSGALTEKKGTWNDLELKVKLRLTKLDNYYNKLEEITEWLINIDDNRLLIDREDKCYLVKYVVVNNIARELKKWGDFEVTFKCAPFLTDFNSTSTKLTTTKNVVSNYNYTGHIASEPIVTIKALGTGDLDIYWNGNLVKFLNVSLNEVIELDSQKLTVYNQNKDNILNRMVGNFPLLLKGNNTIQTSLNAEITIKPNTRYRM